MSVVLSGIVTCHQVIGVMVTRQDLKVESTCEHHRHLIVLHGHNLK
jgi:GTP cyclohydrolase I